MAKSFFRNIYKSGKSDPINYFSVEIYDVDISIINSLKRIIQSNIQLPGFLGEDHHSVTIIENNGPLHNEIITHRIGLIPIHFNEDEVENFDSDEYSFELNEVEIKKYEEWKKTLPKLPSGYFGAAGGGYWIKFIPTGIGVVVTAGRVDVPEMDIDLTDFDSW